MKRRFKLLIFKFQQWKAARAYKRFPTDINLGRLESVKMQVEATTRRLYGAN